MKSTIGSTSASTTLDVRRLNNRPCQCHHHILVATIETVGWIAYEQGDHLSRKPGNVGEFETCQGKVRDFVNSQGIVTENLVMEKCPKTVIKKVRPYS